MFVDATMNTSFVKLLLHHLGDIQVDEGRYVLNPQTGIHT